MTFKHTIIFWVKNNPVIALFLMHFYVNVTPHPPSHTHTHDDPYPIMVGKKQPKSCLFLLFPSVFGVSEK